MNHKQELIELSAKNVLRCIFGNTKFNHDIQLQYDFLMQEATPRPVFTKQMRLSQFE